ncbi:MAG TPA: hypothetical protein PLL82_05845 [Candidatus Aminicenantes bacterium]|nr:hypothetical protein [Candidatus Aminicenantes bacterium]HQF98485.1 hypothetical protein [Candidatus Aminicenantes bacterium]HQH45350.1 hypothetical protein [Candidatus Aminicenantes bacterium]HQJ42778.1 hypothetical protein [Candidatus Aminicenantes bacterium]
MIKKKKTVGTRIAAALLAAALLGGAAAGPGLAETKNVCQAALERCLGDALAGVFGGLVGIIGSLSSCLGGYDFCRKYIISSK